MDDFLCQLRQSADCEPQLLHVFENCYADTLKKAVKDMGDGTYHVITGDIPAMWLRDSAAQMRPYIFAAKKDTEVRKIIAGVVRRQFLYISIDAYANAFNHAPNGACWEKDDPQQSPWVWERKFEIDSLCYPVQLAYLLWKNTGCTSQFDQNFFKGVQEIFRVFCIEQHHEDASAYRFCRNGRLFQDTLSREGKGALVKPGTGLVWSGFRPSDDACTYGYLIPSNMFIVVIMKYLEEMAAKLFRDTQLEMKAAKFGNQVREAIEREGKTYTEEFGMIYAYETDGFGMYRLMDDANVPSLLSMDYLGYPSERNVAENTRRFLFSDANPYYYKGTKAAGIGSAHTPSGYIWHIAMAMQGLTCKDRGEKLEILRKMAATTAGTDRMHEGFFCNDDEKYTREWFSWANAMYVELFLDYLGYRLEK